MAPTPELVPDSAAPVDWTDPSLWSPAAFAKLAAPSDERWAQLEPGPRVLVVAHDAGGAEVVGAWLKRRLLQFNEGAAAPLRPALVPAGPARKIFERLGLLGLGLPVLEFSEAFRTGSEIDWVLSGTGWSTEHERNALREARGRGIPTCAHLDHWTNYRQRFVTMPGGETIRPTHFWVGDIWAEALARDCFGTDSSVLLTPSAYFAAIRADYEQALRTAHAPGDSCFKYLYVTEPISAAAQAQFGDAHWYGYTEIEAVQAFLDLVKTEAGGKEIRLRPHPSEAPDKYAEIIGRNPLVQPSPSQNALLDDCIWADVIVGCNTMAMVVGWLGGRRVLCSIPSTGPDCDLPLPSIVRLFPRQMKSATPSKTIS